MSAQPAPPAGAVADPRAAAPPAIRIEGLQKRFGTQPVLRGVDLTVAPGELMVVIGRSGGGKSVLLRHILRLVRPDAGRIVIGDQDVTRLRGRDLDRVRDGFGVVFQGGALFDSLTVEENVGFFLREHSELAPAEIRKRVDACLDFVNLPGTNDLLPEEISGGM